MVLKYENGESNFQSVGFIVGLITIRPDVIKITPHQKFHSALEHINDYNFAKI